MNFTNFKPSTTKFSIHAVKMDERVCNVQFYLLTIWGRNN